MNPLICSLVINSTSIYDKETVLNKMTYKLNCPR